MSIIFVTKFIITEAMEKGDEDLGGVEDILLVILNNF